MAVGGKPGLWESTIVVNFTQGGPRISPEQIERMKQMGINLPIGRPLVVKSCMTPEMAARNDIPRATRENDHCKLTDYDREGNPITATLICDGDLKGQGKLKIGYDSSTSYKGTMEFTGTDKQGAPLAMQNTFSGKWLGDDCGDVKPPAAMK